MRGEMVPMRISPFSKDDGKTRCGRYHQSVFPTVKEYGMKRWVVCGYLKMKEPEKFEYLTESEIVEGCVAFLNQPPPRKRKPIYGTLAPVLAPWKGIERYDVKFTSEHIAIVLSTDQKRNKNFWGDGLSFVFKPDGRKNKKTKSN